MSPRQKKLITIAVCLCAALVIGIVMNTEVFILQSVDGRIHQVRMPLYAKASEFLSRHYEYRRLAKEITSGCRTEEEKALAILAWTHKNIKPMPSNTPVVDDHILNIIIRGYGIPGQSQDVFTNLCVYAGIPAFCMLVDSDGGRARYPLSFVRLGGKWRPFDSYYDRYFRTRTGDIASVEEIMADRSIVDNAYMADTMVGGAPYKEFYHNLKPIEDTGTLRAEKQMPPKRAIFEVKKALGIEKEELDKNYQK